MPIGVNVALAFNMGTDVASILASPIEQPLATVGYHLASLPGEKAQAMLSRYFSTALVRRVPWRSGHLLSLPSRSNNSVVVLLLIAFLRSRYMMGASFVRIFFIISFTVWH
jgi:hypothetical protein